MSDLKDDLRQSAVDAKKAIVGERRHMVARLLDGLRGHPRVLVVIILVLIAAVITLGLARG